MIISASVSSSLDVEEAIDLNEDQIQLLFDKTIVTVLENTSVVASNEYKSLFNKKCEELEVDLYLCDNREIRKLNNQYRGIDSPTDVLSFSMSEGQVKSDIPLMYLGEIVISTEKLVEQARSNNHSISHELVFLISHGLLHLIGIHHEENDLYDSIIAIQNDVVTKVIISF